MPWLKSVLLDLLCTALIAVYVLLSAEWVSWVGWFVIIYTPFMLLLKLLAVAAPTTRRSTASSRKLGTDAPASFFHVLYGLNVVLLAIGRHWLLAAAWVAIWILSVIFERRTRPAQAK